MILAKSSAGDLIRASAGVEAYCPGCETQVRAKCGQIIVAHFAHFKTNQECTYGPESAWHLRWKDHALSMGWDVEVPLVGPDGTKHRADIVTDRGNVIELQHTPLSLEKIQARERAYGVDRLMWIYDAIHIFGRKPLSSNPVGELTDRITAGKRWNDGGGLRIKHGPKSMTFHEAPIYWHLDRPPGAQGLWKVELDISGTYGSRRVIGLYNIVTEQWRRWLPPPPLPEWLSSPLPFDRSKHPALELQEPDIEYRLRLPQCYESDAVRYINQAIDAELHAIREARGDERNDQIERSAYQLGQLLVSYRHLEHVDSDAAKTLLVAFYAGISGIDAAETIWRSFADGERAPRWIRRSATTRETRR